MKSRCIIILIFVFSLSYAQTLPNVSSGSIKRIENFKSQFIASRNVDVWLPEGYNKSTKYNVVYMHDGQMLFDSTLTWNKKEWKVDEVFSELIKAKRIENCLWPLISI